MCVLINICTHICISPFVYMLKAISSAQCHRVYSSLSLLLNFQLPLTVKILAFIIHNMLVIYSVLVYTCFWNCLLISQWKINFLNIVHYLYVVLFVFCCCSVTHSCPILCDSVAWGTPGLPILYHLLEPTQTHVHWVSDAIPTISSSVVPFFYCVQSFPTSGPFLLSQLSVSGGQSIGVSASASVLPVNTQGWFPSGLTDLILLQPKGLSRVFSNTTVQKHQFFVAHLSLWSNSHILTWLLEKP